MARGGDTSSRTRATIDDLAKPFFRIEEWRMFDWSDVRPFLAVARSGSTLTASRELNVSQPTVARRIAALEAALGLSLFERRQSGYRLTEEGASLMAKAEDVERAAQAFADGAKARARSLAGTVRLTCNEITAGHHLAPMLAEFRRSYPDIRVDVIVSESLLDLGRGEADVAIRATDRPEGPGLVARKMLEMPWSLCCSRDYIDANGKPADFGDLGGHKIIGGEGTLGAIPVLLWLEEVAGAAAVVARANSFPALVANLKAGVGLGVLPWGILADDPSIVDCLRLPQRFDGQVWLVTHERVRRLPRVRAVIDFIAAYTVARRALLPPPLPDAQAGAYMRGEHKAEA